VECVGAEDCDMGNIEYWEDDVDDEYDEDDNDIGKVLYEVDEECKLLHVDGEVGKRLYFRVTGESKLLDVDDSCTSGVLSEPPRPVDDECDEEVDVVAALATEVDVEEGWVEVRRTR
jgi:hypothetical protein